MVLRRYDSSIVAWDPGWRPDGGGVPSSFPRYTHAGLERPVDWGLGAGLKMAIRHRVEHGEGWITAYEQMAMFPRMAG